MGVQSIIDNYEEYIGRRRDRAAGELANLAAIKAGDERLEVMERGDLEEEYLCCFNDQSFRRDELSSADLASLGPIMTKLFQVQFTHDHFAYWQAAYLTLKDMHPIDSELPREIYNQLMNTLSLILCRGHEIGDVPEDIAEYRAVVLQDPLQIGSITAYPVLEGLAKWLANEDIRRDGRPRTRTAIWSQAFNDYYTPNDPINNLGDILWHYEQHLAPDDTREILQETRGELQRFGEDVDRDNAYQLLYHWRNNILHGEAYQQAEAGVISILLSILIFCLARDS